MVDRKHSDGGGILARAMPAVNAGGRASLSGPLRRAAGGIMKGAVVDRLTQRQATDPLTADQVVIRNWRTLVARSRELVRDNDYGRGYLRLVRQNVVGPIGVTLQARVTDAGGRPDRGANDAIEVAWERWGRRDSCTMTGRMSWLRLQLTAIQAAARDGEFFARVHTGRGAGPWGFAIQVIDATRVPVEACEDYLAGGRFIRNGIEFDAYGRALAYFVAVGDRERCDQVIGGRRCARVPADEMIHLYVEDIEGQKRGLPWTATAMWRLAMTGGFEDAALVNARASAAKGGFFEWDADTGPVINGDDLADEDPLYMDAEPGTYQELTPGLRFKEVNPAYPSGEFALFLKAMLRGAAAGLGVAYNNFAGDLEGVNFSSIRAGTLEEREYWKELQEWLIEGLHAQVFDRWLSWSLLSGRVTLENGTPLPVEKRQKFSRVDWQARRWAWIDPEKDVRAQIEARKGLLISTGQLIREAGRDPETVYREIADDIAAMADAGIPDQVIQTMFTTNMQAVAAPPSEEKPDA